MTKTERYTGYYIGCTSDGEIRRVSEYSTKSGSKLSCMTHDDRYITHSVMPGRNSKTEVVVVFNIFDIEFISSGMEGGVIETQVLERIKRKAQERKEAAERKD